MENWHEMDRAALDDAYANAPHIPGGDAFPARWARDAAAFRATARHEGLRYGDGPREHVDLFHPEGAARGVIVFVHGGYWIRFAPSDWSHLARGGLRAGHVVAMPGYPLAPDASIPEITRRVARAVDAVAARIPGPLRLVGHSAGGHLVARMLMEDAAPSSAGRIATCVPVSPVADLRPLVPQALNDTLRLTEASAAAESPALGRPRPGPRAAVHVGAEERPSFLWQADALGAAWDVPVRRAPGRHHFDVVDSLCDPDSPIMRDLLA
jgi:acetyl esterase/lipase